MRRRRIGLGECVQATGGLGRSLGNLCGRQGLCPALGEGNLTGGQQPIDLGVLRYRGGLIQIRIGVQPGDGGSTGDSADFHAIGRISRQVDVIQFRAVLIGVSQN